MLTKCLQGAVFIAAVMMVSEVAADPYDSTYYRLDGGNEGSALNINQMPPTSPWLNIPTNHSLATYKKWTTQLQPPGQAVTNIRSYLNGVSGGTYGDAQTIFTPFWADAVMSSQGQNILFTGYGKGLGKGNNNTINSVMDCWGGSALRENGSIPSCGFGESDYTTGPYTFQAAMAASPGTGAKTLSYKLDPDPNKKPPPREEALGARFLLNNNRAVLGDGINAYVSNIGGQTITFAGPGLSLPQQPVSGYYYIKLGSQKDLYPPPCKDDDINISHPNLGTDNLCIGHWYPVTMIDSHTAMIANNTYWDYVGLRTPGAPRLIRAISKAGGCVTVVTLEPHRFLTGDSVTIAGVNAAYNGMVTGKPATACTPNQPGITVTGSTTFTYLQPGPPANDFGVEYPNSGTISLNSSSFVIVDGVEITSFDTSSKTLNVTENSWAWQLGDTIYSPPNHIMGYIGPLAIFYKGFKTMKGTVGSFAYGASNQGNYNMDYAFTADAGLPGAGFSTIIHASGPNTETGVDFSQINFKDAAIKIAQDTGTSSSNVISFAEHAGRISHDGASLKFASNTYSRITGTQSSASTTWANNNFGVLHLNDTYAFIDGGFTKLTFSNNAVAPGASAAIGAKFENLGSALYFGTSNSYPGVTNAALIINKDGDATFSNKVNLRNNANNADINGLKKNPQDIVQVGDTPGVLLGANNHNVAITGHVSVQETLKFAGFLAQSCGDRTALVKGAAEGDTIAYGIPNALASLAGITWSAWVSSPNHVTVRGCNVTTNKVLNPPPALVRVDVWKH